MMSTSQFFQSYIQFLRSNSRNLGCLRPLDVSIESFYILYNCDRIKAIWAFYVIIIWVYFSLFSLSPLFCFAFQLRRLFQ